MIQESVREMTAEERALLEPALRPTPAGDRAPSRRAIAWAAIGLAVFAVALAVLLVVRPGGMEPYALLLVGATIASAVRLRFAAVAHGRARTQRAWVDAYAANNAREIARILEDGRVTVRRVRAVAVVELESMEDEGTGYLYDLGDGRTLFLKGQDYEPFDEDAPWPATEFEIVRAAHNGRFVELVARGRALRPLRVVGRGELDPQAAWDEREEVLEMGLDDALKTVLRAR